MKHLHGTCVSKKLFIFLFSFYLSWVQLFVSNIWNIDLTKNHCKYKTEREREKIDFLCDKKKNWHEISYMWGESNTSLIRLQTLKFYHKYTNYVPFDEISALLNTDNWHSYTFWNTSKKSIFSANFQNTLNACSYHSIINKNHFAWCSANTQLLYHQFYVVSLHNAYMKCLIYGVFRFGIQFAIILSFATKLL